jgi:hypothetical protein
MFPFLVGVEHGRGVNPAREARMLLKMIVKCFEKPGESLWRRCAAPTRADEKRPLFLPRFGYFFGGPAGILCY